MPTYTYPTHFIDSGTQNGPTDANGNLVAESVPLTREQLEALNAAKSVVQRLEFVSATLEKIDWKLQALFGAHT